MLGEEVRAMAEPRAPRDSLTEILTLDERGGGHQAARLESFWGAAAEGDLLARAVLAASDRAGPLPGAIQASFLRTLPADAELSLRCHDLAPDRRRVEVRHGPALCAEVTLRFDTPRDLGLGYQSAAPERGLPAPEDLPSEREQGEAEGWAQYAVGPVESRRIGEQTPVKEHEPAVWLGWLRPREPLPADPRLHAAALAFLGEYRSHWAVERRLGADFPRSRIVLLDHALWIHRAERWDDFWLVRTSSDVGVAGRCLSRREIFTRSGALVASAAWQARVVRRGEAD
jgi:acyl-CoA thioesterase-2